RGHGGQVEMLAAAVLDYDPNELLGEPVGLIEARPGIAKRAFDLAALERDLSLVAGLVARHDLELVAEDLLHDDGHVDAEAAHAGPADDELPGLGFLQRLHRGRVPYVTDVFVAGRVADPREPGHVEIGGAGIEERRGQHRAVDAADHGAVARRRLVEVTRGAGAAGARHRLPHPAPMTRA